MLRVAGLAAGEPLALGRVEALTEDFLTVDVVEGLMAAV